MAKRKRSRKRRLSYHVRNAAIALIFVLLGLALLWPDIRSAFLRALIPIGRGSSGVLDERVSGDAVFCSGQTVLTAPASGTIRLTVKHGDSVRVGDVIAEIGDKDTLASIEENLASAQARLQRYEEETRDAFQELSGLIQECYQQAVTAFYDVQTAYASGNTADFMEKQRVLEREVDGLSRNRSKLMALEDERSDLVSQVEIMQQVASSSLCQDLAPCLPGYSALILQLWIPKPLRPGLPKWMLPNYQCWHEIRDPEYRIADCQEVTFGDVIGRIVSGRSEILPYGEDRAAAGC